jgi:hypothetical protein
VQSSPLCMTWQRKRAEVYPGHGRDTLVLPTNEGMNSVCRGLEQQVALPRDSYLQHYFRDVTSVMRVGPPLFFVVRVAASWLLACTHCKQNFEHSGPWPGFYCFYS